MKRPEPGCAMGEAVLFLTGGLLYLAGCVAVFLTVRGWRWQ